MFFSKKTAQKLNCIKNNPLAIIATLLTIYRLVIPSMINVGPITPWEVFRMLYTCILVVLFKNILFNAIRKTCDLILEIFNKKICLADEISDEIKA